MVQEHECCSERQYKTVTDNQFLSTHQLLEFTFILHFTDHFLISSTHSPSILDLSWLYKYRKDGGNGGERKEQTDVWTIENRMCDVKTQLLQQMLAKKQQTVSTFLPLLVLFSFQKDAVQKVMCFPMIQQPLLQLVSLAQQTLDLWLHSVHVRDERAVVMGLAVQIHLQGTFAFLNLEVA